MSFKDYVETEKAQVQVLIDQYKDKIKALEQDLEDWGRKAEEGEPGHTSTTPAAVAADPDATSEERAAAANAVLGQNPEQVNAEQSFPTPSTHDSAKAESEARYAELHKDLTAEAQRDDRDGDKELHKVETGDSGQVADPDETEKAQGAQAKAEVKTAPKVETKPAIQKADDSKGK